MEAWSETWKPLAASEIRYFTVGTTLTLILTLRLFKYVLLYMV